MHLSTFQSIEYQFNIFVQYIPNNKIRCNAIQIRRICTTYFGLLKNTNYLTNDDERKLIFTKYKKQYT